MPKELPARPNLDRLKNQAKSILHAHERKEPEVCERLRILRRFAGKRDAEILSSEVALSEVQFLLALEYGFKSWVELKDRVMEIERRNAAGGKRFNRLADLDALSDKGIQQVLRAIEAGDLSLAMLEVPAALRDRIAENMSERARSMMWEDMRRLADYRFNSAILATAGQVLLDIANGIADLDFEADAPRIRELDDLTALTDRQIQLCLRELDQEDVVAAMPTLSPNVRDRIFANMSDRAAAMVREDMGPAGAEPVNPEIAFRARRKVLKAANRIVDQPGSE